MKTKLAIWDNQRQAHGFTGNKTIKVTIHFFTDGIAALPGCIAMKHSWDAGVVSMRANPEHGIKSSQPIPFNDISEIPSAIRRLMKRHGLKVHQ